MARQQVTNPSTTGCEIWESFLLFPDYIVFLPGYHGASDWLQLPANGLRLMSEFSEPTATFLPPQEIQGGDETNQEAHSKALSVQSGVFFQGAEHITSPNSNLDSKKQNQKAFIQRSFALKEPEKRPGTFPERSV